MKVKLGEVVQLNQQKRTRLRDNRVALKKELEYLQAKETSMAMLLHAIVRRHGRQVFALDAIESCDPAGVSVSIDDAQRRVVVDVVDLTTRPDSSDPA